MTLYQRKRLSTAEDVGEPGPLPAGFGGLSAELLADLSWRGHDYADIGFFAVPEAPATPAIRWLNKIYVISRIPVQKQAAILLASTLGSPTYDIEVAVVFFQLTQSGDIDLDGELLLNGTALLASKGLIDADDIAAIRADP